MNFLKGIIHKNKDQYLLDLLNIKDIPLPKERMKSFNEQFLDKEVVVGVRPRAISVNGDAEYVKQGFKATINLFEQLGEETNLYVSMDGFDKDVIITTSGLGRFTNGQNIELSFNFNDVCLFDEETEKSLL